MSSINEHKRSCTLDLGVRFLRACNPGLGSLPLTSAKSRPLHQEAPSCFPFASQVETGLVVPEAKSSSEKLLPHPPPPAAPPPPHQGFLPPKEVPPPPHTDADGWEIEWKKCTLRQIRNLP